MFKVQFHSPNGQPYCFWLAWGALSVTLGLVPSVAGFDICWRNRMVLAVPRSQRM